MTTFGEELRRQRELKAVSLREISDATKINIRFLEALEKNEFKHLPGGQFNKGFIRAYARHININSEDMVEAYLLEVKRQEEGARGGGRATSLGRTGGPVGARFIVALLVATAALAAVCALWFVVRSKQPASSIALGGRHTTPAAQDTRPAQASAPGSAGAGAGTDADGGGSGDAQARPDNPPPGGTDSAGQIGASGAPPAAAPAGAPAAASGASSGASPDSAPPSSSSDAPAGALPLSADDAVRSPGRASPAGQADLTGGAAPAGGAAGESGLSPNSAVGGGPPSVGSAGPVPAGRSERPFAFAQVGGSVPQTPLRAPDAAESRRSGDAARAAGSADAPGPASPAGPFNGATRAPLPPSPKVPAPASIRAADLVRGPSKPIVAVAPAPGEPASARAGGAPAGLTPARGGPRPQPAPGAPLRLRLIPFQPVRFGLRCDGKELFTGTLVAGSPMSFECSGVYEISTDDAGAISPSINGERIYLGRPGQSIAGRHVSAANYRDYTTLPSEAAPR